MKILHLFDGSRSIVYKGMFWHSFMIYQDLNNKNLHQVRNFSSKIFYNTFKLDLAQPLESCAQWGDKY